ncbi:MAG: hypothetical protein WEB90_04610 [Gemmatimonadota bacterium]
MSDPVPPDPAAPRGAGEPRGRRTRLRAVGRGLGATALFLAITLTFFVLLEGAVSTASFLRNVLRQQDGVVLTEEEHTRYDPDLGWVSLPDVTIPDMYGPGKTLTTNSRGFRGRSEVEPSVPEGKRRILCSGDSFTLGHGVADEDTWCARLASLDPTLESVNMGQGGYGIDQAFLWYGRDGADLERSVHVLAFIGDDFLRVQSDHFLGYGKPRLELSGGSLLVTHTPAPRRSRLVRWMIQNGPLFRELASVRVLSSIVSGSREVTEAATTNEDRTWAVTAAMFDSLARENTARGARFVLLFLPTPWDYDTDLYDGWRSRVRAYADSTGVPLVDLVDDLREMTSEEQEALFIPPGEIGAPHLDESGNEWVARRLVEEGVLGASTADWVPSP